MASKYIPPHFRAAAAGCGPASEPAAPASQSHADWLRAQQNRYTHTVKTAEQIRAECAAMTFEQLRSRAGPPPTVFACEFVWAAEGCRPDEVNDPENSMFDGRIVAFKRGQGPPPAPLAHNQRDDTGMANKNVNAYAKWYVAWGSKLTEKWYHEHPRPVAAKTAKSAKSNTVEESKGPSRVIEEDAGDKSGW
jgi:hypothetical protein